MPKFIVNITPELQERVNNWSKQVNQPPENLAVSLLEEYFDDRDDADRLETLISNGHMRTYPAEVVHKELDNLAVMDS